MPRAAAAGPRCSQVTSLANPIVKEIRALALPKNRKASGLFVAEGLKLVADAVEAGWTDPHAGLCGARSPTQPLVGGSPATITRAAAGAGGQRGGARQDHAGATTRRP